MHIGNYVCMYVYTCVTNEFVYTGICVQIYFCTHVCKYAFTYVCMYICIYVCTFVCLCVSLIIYFKIQSIIHRIAQECAGTSHIYAHYFQTHKF